MRCFHCAVVVVLSVCAWQGQAASCSEDAICIIADDSDRGVSFSAQNFKPYPITVTLRVSTRNLSPDDPQPTTLTIPAHATRPVQEFVISDRPYRYRYWFDWTIGEHDPNHDSSYRYRLPYEEGKSYRTLQGFGSRFTHTGLEEFAVDFKMPVGTPIHAAREGVVVRTEERHNKACFDRGCGRYANYVVILHDDNTTGEYYHLQQNGVVVEEGERVKRGQLIAYSGNTGRSTMPHLHFAVYRADSWGRTQSLPFVFDSAKGIIRNPRAGKRYKAGP